MKTDKQSLFVRVSKVVAHHKKLLTQWRYEVNLAPIFFLYKLLPTTSGPQKFKKIGVVKVDYFDFAGEVFEKCELDVRVIACNF